MKIVFSEVRGGRFSKVNSLSYNILHVIVPIGGGSVVESSARQKGLKFALSLLGANEADTPFFCNRNEFVVSDCLRQYLGLAVRCRSHDFLPMMSNLFVKFREMAIKIKKVVVIITLKELCAANTRERRFWNILPRCI